MTSTMNSERIIDSRMLPFSINRDSDSGQIVAALEQHVEWVRPDAPVHFAASLAVLLNRYCGGEACSFILQARVDTEQIVDIALPADECCTIEGLTRQLQTSSASIGAAPAAAVRLLLDAVGFNTRAAGNGLQLSLREEAGQVILAARAPACWFHADDLTRFLTQWALLAQRLQDWPGDVRHVPLLSALDAQHALARWSPLAGQAAPLALIDRFCQVEARYPQKPAVTDENESLTFAQLAQRAGAISAMLREHGITRGARVAVHLTRSTTSVATLLALLDVGAVYVPVDPAYPHAYVGDILRASRPDLIVTSSVHADRLPSHDAPLVRVEEIVLGAKFPGGAANQRALSDPFAILFTSGSTGKPKAVVHSQLSFARRFEWMWSILPVAADEVFAQRTALGFGPHIWESLGGLLQGAHTVIVSDLAGKDPRRLVQLLSLHRVTRAGFVPSLLRVILYSSQRLDLQLPHLRMCSLAGEPLKESLYHACRQTLPGVRIFVDFGSTEINGIFFCDADTRPVGETSFPLGWPMPHARVFVLDQQKQPVPPGMPGDLHVGGESLALGYRRQDGSLEAVADQHVPDVDCLLFNTGDRVRYLPDGRLVSMGREDSQVKIRGMRVNLAQVELALGTLPTLRAAHALLWKKRNGDERLVAVAEATNDAHLSDIYAAARQLLPQHMVPDEIRLTKSLPRLLNGKIDRQALEHLFAQSTQEVQQISGQDVASILRQLIAKIGEHRLTDSDDIDQVGIGDLGIDSLAVSALSLAIAEHLRIDITATQLFACDTFGRLAHYVQQRLNGHDATVATGAQLAQDRRELTTAVDQLAYADELATDGASLITGATGFLGIHVLDALLQHSEGKVYCLVRAASHDAAWQALCKASLQYALTVHLRQERIVVVLGDISAPRLGLFSEVYLHLAEAVCRIFHCAATVNHVAGYSQLRPANVLGTMAVLELAAARRCKHIVFASTVGVCLSGRPETSIDPCPEALCENGADIASAYGQSKWLAEHLIWRYAVRSRAQVSLFRIGEIAGHSVTGLGRRDDIFHHAIKLFLDTGKVPIWPDGVIDLVPVDFAAQVLVATGLSTHRGPGVYHLTHPDPMPIQAFFQWALPAASDQPMHMAQWRACVALQYDQNKENYLRGLSVLVNCGDGEIGLETYFQALPLQQTRLLSLLTEFALAAPPIDCALWEIYFQEFQRQGFLSLAGSRPVRSRPGRQPPPSSYRIDSNPRRTRQ